MIRLVQIQTPEQLKLVCGWKALPELAEYFRRFNPAVEPTIADLAGTYLIYDEDFAVGLVNLHALDMQVRKMEFGVLVAPEIPKRLRIAKAACEQVADYAFDYLGLNKLTAHILTHRDDLVRVLRMHGFEQDGLLRDNCFFDGRFHDEYAFSLLRKDYVRR